MAVQLFQAQKKYQKPKVLQEQLPTQARTKQDILERAQASAHMIGVRGVSVSEHPASGLVFLFFVANYHNII